MWLVGSRTFDIYLGTRAVAVCHGDRRVSAEATAGVDAGLAVLTRWSERSERRLNLRVWLSGGLCRPFVVPAAASLKNATELRRVASALVGQQTGLNGECEVWVDRGACVAVAVERATLRSLETALTGSVKHRIASIRPWWSDAQRCVLARDPDTVVVAAQDCDSLTVLAGAGDRPTMASTVTPLTDRATADAALARLLLSSDGAEGKRAVFRLIPLGKPASARSSDMALSTLVEHA